MSLIIALLLFVYILTSPGTMQSLDEQIMYQATESLAHGRLEIVHPAGVVGRDGLHYSKYGFGLPLIALPFWAVGALIGKLLPAGLSGFAARFIVAMINPVLSALTGGVLYLFVWHLLKRRRLAVFIALAWGLGTLAWPYTQTFFSETAVGLFLLTAFYFLLRLDQTGHSIDAWLSGLCIGLAILVRPAAIVTGIGTAVYLFLITYGSKRWSDLVRFSVAVTVAVTTAFLYNWLRFESVFAFGYGTEGFTNPILTGLYGFLFSPGKSMFLYSPIILLSIPGLFLLARIDKALTISVTVTVSVTILFYSAWAGWDNWSWGPRYLVPLLPLLLLGVGAFVIGSRQYGKIIAVILMVLSLAIQLYALPVSAQRMYYRLYMSGDSQYMQKSQFDWRHSPLLEQAKDLSAVWDNARHPEKLRQIAKERDVSEARGKQYYFDHNINYQALNFWWYYLFVLSG